MGRKKITLTGLPPGEVGHNSHYMKRIYKYCIPVQGFYSFSTYKGFSLLDIQPQGNTICMWAVVDISQPAIMINLCILGTGMPLSPDHQYYIGTVQQEDLVWHIFADQVLDPWNPKHFVS